MKPILIVILCLFVRCSVMDDLIREDQLTITKAYKGRLVETFKTNKGFTVRTEREEFHVIADTLINAIPGNRCWLILVEKTQINMGSYYKPYLTFEPDSILYELKFNRFICELE